MTSLGTESPNPQLEMGMGGGPFATRTPGPEPVASYKHSLGFLGIMAALVLGGYVAQHQATGGEGLTATHRGIIPLYLSTIFANGMLVYFVWGGVRDRGGNVFDLIGGRWTRWRDLGRDLLIAAPFWVGWRAAMLGMAWMLGESHAKTVNILLPQGALEVTVWIAVSAMAGFCEELVFRGYVQRQVLALSRRTWVAVIGQGLLFGVAHAYQGWEAVLIISGAGMLLGGLAAWRRNLRVGMVVHGFADVWAGWLRQACGASF